MESMIGYALIGLALAAWATPGLLARVVLFAEMTFRRVDMAIDDLEDCRAERHDASYVAELKGFTRADIAALRADGGLDSLITARHAEIVQGQSPTALAPK